MINRRILLATLTITSLGVSGVAFAADNAFTSSVFEKAKASGKPVLVEVTAPWCSVCKVQKPILSELKAQPRFKDLSTYTVDFDSQKEALRLLGVRMQSTLIVYRGGQEVGRSTGETSKAAIESLLVKAL